MEIEVIEAADLNQIHNRHRLTVWLVGVDQTRFEPPMLIEGVTEARDPLLEGWIDLSVWTKGHRIHQMTGIIVDPKTPITITFNPEEN